jgi:hypothetical protein
VEGGAGGVAGGEGAAGVGVLPPAATGGVAGGVVSAVWVVSAV